MLLYFSISPILSYSIESRYAQVEEYKDKHFPWEEVILKIGAVHEYILLDLSNKIPQQSFGDLKQCLIIGYEKSVQE
jgi:hypothetical protein